MTGTGAVTFSRDDGATLAPTSEPARPINYTYGLAVTDEPNLMYALHGSSLLRSDDAGCTWSTVAQITGWDFPPTLAAAPGARLYIWSDNRDFFGRFDGRTFERLRAPTTSILGFVVDPANPDRLRLGGGDSTLWDSFDGGRNWTLVHTLQPLAPGFYRWIFDPSDLDHIILGTVTRGAWTTFDGAKNWIQAAGLGEQNNVFSLAFSPVDSGVVWARAINTADDTRNLYRSTDGGRSFERFLSDSADVFLTNQPLLVPHPTDPSVLYVPFGTFFQGYGTDLYRYDAALDRLTKTHNDYQEIDAIAFNPGDPALMYVGISAEQ